LAGYLNLALTHCADISYCARSQASETGRTSAFLVLKLHKWTLQAAKRFKTKGKWRNCPGVLFLKRKPLWECQLERGASSLRKGSLSKPWRAAHPLTGLKFRVPDPSRFSMGRKVWLVIRRVQQASALQSVLECKANTLPDQAGARPWTAVSISHAERTRRGRCRQRSRRTACHPPGRSSGRQ
jgi:hypothetical protein